MVHNMSSIPSPPSPKSPLGRYRLLSPSASVRVSPFCLSGMNFGRGWDGEGSSQDEAETVLDFYYDHVCCLCNFIDTANNYQGGESERIIGGWMARRHIRDQLVIATKYSTNFRAEHGEGEIMINSTGNSAKSLTTSVHTSLENLQTDYIDILYVHWWDQATDFPELMQSLNHLVAAGKVLYLGASNMPAWVVSRANEYARGHGLRPFSIYQGRWSAASRDIERDIAPMALSEGMAIVASGAFSGPAFSTAKHRATSKGRKPTLTDNQLKLSRALEAIAGEKRTTLGCIALAYVMQKQPYVFPLISNPTIGLLERTLEAIITSLSKTDMSRIEAAVPFNPGFPLDLLF
ncbi:Aryl-alcohol dehydrogenase (NADP(+)) [Scedosporium apiospermum]|uniref:Aryl-alcohol dehydrogenase (NADP(+)) n=1 Tax=Pseudallescheria apiosperma TaxID=563466 RepID=A0A084G1N4_PSEDA|nr:Aryl-alcohol dehydrogenase (NADP(+)) [Scedosporium apiospermum]KEZ41246.1 Aryl-alcohol dehydrogenase (NADP(+)) [Scedosporium apiospermum]